MCESLSPDALLILYILYSNRCLNSSAGYHSKKLEKICRKKMKGDFDNAIRELKGKYITLIKKREIKYYISDVTMAVFALKDAGYTVVEGKTRKI